MTINLQDKVRLVTNEVRKPSLFKVSTGNSMKKVIFKRKIKWQKNLKLYFTREMMEA